MANRGGATRPNGPNQGNKICQFKLVLLGESAVGKSSLVLRFVKGQFHEFQESTIGGMSVLMSRPRFFEQACKSLCKHWYYWHTYSSSFYMTHTGKQMNNFIVIIRVQANSRGFSVSVYYITKYHNKISFVLNRGNITKNRGNGLKSC